MAVVADDGGDGDAVTRRRSFLNRSLAPITVNGIRHATLTLASTALGGGVLSVSYVLKLQGILFGVLLLVAGGTLAFLSTNVLMRMSAETGHVTYAGLFAHCAGPRAGPVLDFMLFIFGIGVCVGYNVFLGDFIPPLVRLARPDAPSWLASRELAIAVSSLAVLPLALQRDLSALRFVAPISILSLVYIALTVTAKAPFLYNEHLSDPEGYGPVVLFSPDMDTFEAFALCVFAFNCHLNVVPVAGSMLRPTKARILKVSVRVNALQLAFYATIGVSGYLSFLKETPQDVILGYNATDVAVAIGRMLLTFTVLVAIPTNLNPTIRSGMALLAHYNGVAPMPSPPVSPQATPRLGPVVFSVERSDEDDARTMSRPLAPEREDPLPPLTLEPIADPEPARDPAAELPAEPSPAASPTATAASPPEPFAAFRSPLVVVLFCMQAGLAVIVPGVADVLSILGATVATAMMLTIPAYAMGIVLPITPKRRAMQAVLYIFSVVSVASVPIKILRAAGLIPGHK